MFKTFFNKFQRKKDVYSLYSKIVDQARSPEFYMDYNVEDTVDGRFDMILLHLFLLLYRLEDEGEEEGMLQRQLQEAFVTDMDRSLREMGVGDMNVGKHVKKMSVAWFGRAAAYRDALDANDNNAMLVEALKRNVYRDKDNAASSKLASYVVACCDTLREQSVHDIKIQPNYSSPNGTGHK